MKYLLRLATQRTFPETTRSGAATFDPATCSSFVPRSATAWS